VSGTDAAGGAPPPVEGDDPLGRGVEALQAAAPEVITATRAMLDVAEDLVRDPRAASTVLGAVDAMSRAAGRFAPGRAAPDDDDLDDGDGGVQRIPVS